MDIERQKRIELARLEAIFKALEDPNSELCRWLATFDKGFFLTDTASTKQVRAKA